MEQSYNDPISEMAGTLGTGVHDLSTQQMVSKSQLMAIQQTLVRHNITTVVNQNPTSNATTTNYVDYTSYENSISFILLGGCTTFIVVFWVWFYSEVCEAYHSGRILIGELHEQPDIILEL